jgi:tRNA dimethylallyltransferase
MPGTDRVGPSSPKIILIVGPTASGKTSLALKIAAKVPSEIISADSRQLYRHLDIGTAKPLQEEMAGVPHHMIDIREPNETFNAGDFQETGRKKIIDIASKGKIPIVVGGTGLYVRALIDGFFEQPEFKGHVRKQLEGRLEKEGKDALFKELQFVDSESATSMDATKYRRVIRALEVFYETGIPISKFHANHRPDKMYDAQYFGLNWKRDTLYERINQRVDKMLTAGFLDEVQHLHSMGFDDRYQSLQTVGYKEAFAFLRHEISYDRMVELMKQNTRRFAKRQLTWFRKEKRIDWLTVVHEEDFNDIATEVLSRLKE